MVKQLSVIDDKFGDEERVGVGALFYGNSGNGKTLAMVTLMKDLLMKYSIMRKETTSHYLDEPKKYIWVPEYWPECVFINATTIFRLIRKFDEENISKIKKTICLFIDDFGTQSNTDFAFSEFDELIDYRYKNMLPTFISTNLSKQQFGEIKIMARMIDRWRECMDFIHVPGESMRKKIRQEKS